MSSLMASDEERLVQRVLAVIRFLREPAFPGLVLMGGLLLAGFGAIFFAWVNAARTIHVPLQLPAIISGGIAGVALVGVGVALFDLQMARREAAAERRLTDDLLDEVASLMGLVPDLRRHAGRTREKKPS